MTGLEIRRDFVVETVRTNVGKSGLKWYDEQNERKKGIMEDGKFGLKTRDNVAGSGEEGFREGGVLGEEVVKKKVWKARWIEDCWLCLRPKSKTWCQICIYYVQAV